MIYETNQAAVTKLWIDFFPGFQFEALEDSLGSSANARFNWRNEDKWVSRLWTLTCARKGTARKMLEFIDENTAGN